MGVGAVFITCVGVISAGAEVIRVGATKDFEGEPTLTEELADGAALVLLLTGRTESLLEPRATLGA